MLKQIVMYKIIQIFVASVILVLITFSCSETKKTAKKSFKRL